MTHPWETRFVLLLSVLALSSGELFAGLPLPPPVDITIQKTFLSGGEIEITATIIARQDVHLDMSCLLPEGVKVIAERPVLLPGGMSSLGNPFQPGVQRYPRALWLWAGEMKRGHRRELSFRVKVTDGKSHQLAVRAKALAEWGIKETVVEIP